MIEYNPDRVMFYEATQAGWHKKDRPDYKQKFTRFYLELLSMLREREMLKEFQVSLQGIGIHFVTSIGEIHYYFFTYDYLEIYLENPVEFFNKKILTL